MKDLQEFREHINNEISELEKSISDMKSSIPLNEFQRKDEVFKLYEQTKIECMEMYLRILKRNREYIKLPNEKLPRI